MKKKTKTKKFPPAPGSEVLPDEYFLGMLIQNAAARGLRACRELYFQDVLGLSLSTEEANEKAVACCAEGARRLEKDTLEISGDGLVNGNDDFATQEERPEYAIGSAFFEALS